MTHEVDDFLLQDGYLFRSHKLYIHRTSLRDFLVRKLHVGGACWTFLGGTRQLKL